MTASSSDSRRRCSRWRFYSSGCGAGQPLYLSRRAAALWTSTPSTDDCHPDSDGADPDEVEPRHESTSGPDDEG